VECDADMEKIYENKGSALYKITEPKKRITKFKQLKDGETYGVFSRYEQSFSEEIRWQQKEDAAMEEEVGLALKNYLHSHLGSTVNDMSTEVFASKGKTVQEWDAAFMVDDVLYLCEAKHVMSSDKLPKISQRIQTFKEQFLPHYQESVSVGINKVIGVACGTYFPSLVRKEAHDLGLRCVYPSGWRYGVDKTLPIGFKMEP
jgi:superfamily II DNA or RNA helicase